jgi:hypothetical protein
MAPKSVVSNDGLPPLFRVRFHGGATVITAAANALRAEQKARRQRPGFVESVRIVKGKC